MRYAKRIIAALLLILSLAIAFPGKVPSIGIHQDFVDSDMQLRRWYLSWYPDSIAITFIAIDEKQTQQKSKEFEVTVGQFERTSAEITITDEHDQQKRALLVTTCITLNRWFAALLLAIFPVAVIRSEYHQWRLRRTADHPCPHCRYNLTGNKSGVCPECGSAVTPAIPSSDS